MKKKRARDEYLTYDDWETAKRRFEAGTKKLFADLVEFEPVLAEAVAQRSCELSKTIDAQDLTPETKVHLKAQSMRKLGGQADEAWPDNLDRADDYRGVGRGADQRSRK